MNAKIRTLVFLAVAAFVVGGSMTYGASLPFLLRHCLSKQAASLGQTPDTSPTAALRFAEVRRSLRNRRRTSLSVSVAMIDRLKPPLPTASRLPTNSAFFNATDAEPGSLFHPPA